MPGFTVGTYDVGADNRENLLAAINAQNAAEGTPTNYTLQEFGFNDPERVTIPTPKFNTKIKLGPLAATGMIGFKTIYYNRVHASEIGPMKLTWQNEQYLTEMLPRLSQKYGCSFQPDDVYEQIIVPPVAPETEVNITLNFKETSVAYYGGTQIILGTNDPALEFETPENLPFKSDLVFYVNNFIRTKNDQNYLESSVLSIASDRLRSRTMNVTNVDATPYMALVKNTYDDAQRAKLQQYLPFVFTWMVGEAKTIRGVNIYGDVVEINETSNLVVKKSSIVTMNALDKTELNLARSKIMVREGCQDATGSVYLLVGDPANNKAVLKKSNDYGETWVDVPLTITNMASFNYANWDTVVIHDMMVQGNKLSILVTNPNTYGTHPTKRSDGPAVEEFDLVSGACDYFPINPEFVTNTKFKLKFSPSDQLRFVSPEAPTAILDVVAVTKTSHSLEQVVVYCHREDTQEFTAEIMGSQFLSYPIRGLAAYSKPLEKDPAGKFVSVEMMTIVPSAHQNDFFLIETNKRGLNTAMGYGVVTMSGIRKGTQLGGWTESFIDLGGGSQPTMVTVSEKGKRNHYFFSGGNGIYNVKFEESSPNVFVPTSQKVFDVGSHPGFNLECDIGNGSYVTPSLKENLQMPAVYHDFPDEESLKLPIGFSFLGRNKVTGKDIWLTAPAQGDPLEERVFGGEYKHLGAMPVAVFGDKDSNIYVWTKQQGIYKSSDGGNSWTDASQTFSNFESKLYLGGAEVELQPKDFLEASVMGDIIYAIVNPKRSVSIFEIATNNPNFQLLLDDKVVYRVNFADPAVAVPFNSNYMTTALNSTSNFSPRKLIGWDTDSNNNIRAAAHYTELGADETINQLDIPDSILPDVFDTYSDVGFLGRKLVALAFNAATGFNLYTVKDDDTIERTGLKFADTPVYGNFVPKSIFPLWGGSDDAISYTPVIITSDTKEVLVLERDGIAGGAMTVSMAALTLAGDTNKPLQWVSMFSSNRTEAYVFQEGNGVFKPEYEWDGAAGKSNIKMIKLFDTAALNIESIYSGAEIGLENKFPYDESVIGPWPPRDTVLGEGCDGYDKRQKLADGFGGYYWKVIEKNAESCGFVTPVPGDTGYGGGNFNIGG
jgi:hypothetical protein